MGVPPPIVFYGVDGRESGLETKHTYEIDNPGSNYHIGPKIVSMFLSHWVLWNVLAHVPGDSFLIFEDDVRMEPDWKPIFDESIFALPKDWDLCYVGSCCVDDMGVVSGHLHRVSKALCTHAYMVNRKAVQPLIDNCRKIWANIDIAIYFDAFPKMKVYAILPRIAYQIDTVIPP
jgi:GR25 family glycosyltransferase involved in LPS biosynthesis